MCCEFYTEKNHAIDTMTAPIRNSAIKEKHWIKTINNHDTGACRKRNHIITSLSESQATPLKQITREVRKCEKKREKL